MTNIASGDQLFVKSLIGNSDETANSKFINFYRTYSGLGLLISKVQSGSYVAVASDARVDRYVHFSGPIFVCKID